MDIQALQDLGDHIEAALSDDVRARDVTHGELTMVVQASAIQRVIRFLRDSSNCRFEQLIDVCGVDYPERDRRFEVVYHLLSYSNNLRIRIKIEVAEDEAVASVSALYSSANWWEREVWDLFGIYFTDHPDLRRLLTDYGFEGHPLRKDFPLTGYVELRYDEEQKRVVYEPVRLTQDFRTFDFMSPWEGTQYVLPGDEKAGDGADGAEK